MAAEDLLALVPDFALDDVYGGAVRRGTTGNLFAGVGRHRRQFA